MANFIAPVITIDGFGGAGKGTLSLKLAKRLGWHFLDSGAIYRVLALSVLTHQIPADNEALLSAHALQLELQFMDNTVLLSGTDVTADIRSEACGNYASRISVYPVVRAALLEKQREFRQRPGLVADGRDMGTVVFPDADFKVFLTASPEIRARRRVAQLQAAGINVSLADVLAELTERDKRDMARAAAPLKPAEDAWILDTTSLAVNEAFEFLLDKLKSRRLKTGELFLN